MAEQTVDVGDRGSPEYVAWLLFRTIAVNEGKFVGSTVKADKNWTLHTYEQCLAVARGSTAEHALKKG